MAHKTSINGTAYEIKGGKTLINGTAYKIKSGKTLVGGTAYGIDLKDECIVKIIYSFYSGTNEVSVTINGVCYDRSNLLSMNGSTVTANAITISVPIGTEMFCKVAPWGSKEAAIYINNALITSSKTNTITYTYQIVSDVNVTLAGSSALSTGSVSITEV